MKAVLRITVGMVVSTLLLCLVAGVQQAFMLLLISIVCTAGIGLVGLIPLWWGIGSIFLAIVGWDIEPDSSDPVDGSSAEPSATSDATSDELSLLRFLRRARARGMDDVKIDRALIGAGWSQDEIVRARQSLIPTSTGA